MTTSLTGAPRTSAGRLLLWLGLAVAVLGIAGYVVQLRAERLTTPWYLPAAATLGAVLVAAALWQRRTAWRWLALVLVVLLAGAEWTMLLVLLRLPAYTG